MLFNTEKSRVFFHRYRGVIILSEIVIGGYYCRTSHIQQKSKSMWNILCSAKNKSTWNIPCVTKNKSTWNIPYFTK